MKSERDTAKIQSEKHYILLMLSATGIDQVRRWFESISASLHLEEIFVADIKGKAPLEQPIGFAALLKFNSIAEMRASITKIATELRQHDSWTFDFMKTNWIDINSGLTARVQNDSKRLVTTDGRISFKKRRYHISERLRGEYVDLSVDHENLNVYHSGVLVKTFRLRN